MHPRAYARQAPLPVAIDRRSGLLLTLAEWQEAPDRAADAAALTPEQQIGLVRARWEAGGWRDIIYGAEGEVTLEQALRELEAQSELGRDLLAMSLRAMEMAREDAVVGEAS